VNSTIAILVQSNGKKQEKIIGRYDFASCLQ